MRVPLSWLKEYVDIKVPLKELAHRLTMSGNEVANIEVIGGWDNCYVGHVLQVEPHPNADRLTLCTVDIGTETWKVVCGAPNVAAGQKICFARTGARLFSPHTGKQEVLKAAKIRGVVSEGMICSELELGLGTDHNGIVVLDPAASVGMTLDQYLGDAVLDIEVTPNRPDCLSVVGIAHEVAALTGEEVREPDITYLEGGGPISDSISVEIRDPELCPRYTATLVKGIKIGPSPRWMQDRLIRAGQRPINNVVDITNYVMLELGQPLHSFDYEAIGGKKIIVRRASGNERLMTLDGVERHLATDMLVIADANDAVALAGVIGGANSEMGELTKSVLLESANFNPINNRRTNQALKLRTEASLRFEKGLRPELAEVALRRATRLIRELAGGTVSQGIADAFPERERYAHPYVLLTDKRIAQVLGIAIPAQQTQRILESLGFKLKEGGQGVTKVMVPYWRSDIAIEDDLVEELARIEGYDSLPTEMLSTPIPHHEPQPLREFRERIRDVLMSAGLQEVITYSLTSEESLRKAGVWNDAIVPLRVSNPMSVDVQCMRTSLRPSLLRTVAGNVRRQERPLRLFEVGRVYMPQKGDLPDERETAVVVLAGSRFPTSWLTPDERVDFYDAKGIVEALLTGIGLKGTFQAADSAGLHPGKTAKIIVSKIEVGIVGEVHPTILGAFDLDDVPVAIAEIDIGRLLNATGMTTQQFKPIPRFPSAVRDISILVDSSVPGTEIQEAILQQGLVARVTLFDVYEGERLSKGQRSLAFRIHFQSSTRTLTTEDVTRAMDGVVQMIGKQFGARLRQ